MYQTFAMVTIAVIQVVISDVSVERTFQKATGSVNIKYEDAHVFSDVKSKIQCSGVCDRYSWCNAISWNQLNKTCHGFTKSLLQGDTPSNVSQFYTSNKVVCLGEGYLNTLEMCIKFFTGKQIGSWQVAEDFCISEGGRLVVADTMEKFNYIQNQIRHDPTLNGLYMAWWIGARKHNDGNWKWTTGQKLSEDLITRILVDQQGIAYCLAFYLANLHDNSCHDVEAIPICEK